MLLVLQECWRPSFFKVSRGVAEMIQIDDDSAAAAASSSQQPEPEATANAKHNCPRLHTTWKLMGLATHTPQQQSTSTEAEALREPLDVDWTWTNLISQVRCASAETAYLYLYLLQRQRAGQLASTQSSHHSPMDWWIGDRPVSPRRLRNPRQRQCVDNISVNHLSCLLHN